MPNQYLYLSSKNSENHADFNCDLPSGLRITPYSQLRVLSCRLNIDPNVLIIDSTNNVFYLGIDHWNKNGSIIPLLYIAMVKGEYDVTQSTADSDLCAMLKEQIDKALLPYCFVRGGVSVSIADRKLTFKVSGMNMYTCPTIDFTQAVSEYWANERSNILSFPTTITQHSNPSLARSSTFVPFTGILQSDVLFDTDTYKGVTFYKNDEIVSYHVSSPIVTGLTGGTGQSPFLSHIININFSGMTEEETQIGVVPTRFEAPDYVKFCFGESSYNQLSSSKFDKEKLDNLYNPGDTMTSRQTYNLELTNGYIMLLINSRDETKFFKKNVGGTGIYNIKSRFQIKYSVYDDAYGSYQNMVVQISNAATGNTWADIPFDNASELLNIPCDISRQQTEQSNDNLAILMYARMEITPGMISYTMACDDLLDQGVGFIAGNPAGSFGVHTSKNANIPRLLTILSDNINAPKDGSVSDSIMNYMAEAQNNAGMFQQIDASNLDKQELDNDNQPTAECLAIDATSGIGMQTTAASYVTGIVSQSNLITSGIEYPLFYVSIPSLPIKNYSASDSKGIENQFVCAVELEESQSSSFYTSKIYTEQYNILQNAQDIEIDSIHIRICDIDSVGIEALKKYTTLVIEIKEDPRLEQQMLFKNLKDYIERKENVPQIIDYQ